MLEEALTGLGFREVFAWGTAYKGRLLSLRCMIHSFRPKKTVGGTYRNSSYASATVQGSGTEKKVPFVRGFMLMASKEEYIPCSKEFVAMQTAMVKASGYSGSLCSQAKLDNHKRIKLLELNARFCGTMQRKDELFLLSYVPLAFAMVEADPVLHASLRHKLFEGAHNHTFQAIAANETRALQTGGGWHNGKWLEVEKFDPELRIERLAYSYHAMQ